MEPVSTLVGTIVKVVPEIVKAQRTARRNRARCRELARRADAVASVLCDSKAVLASGGGEEAARWSILCRLKDALGDALALVESCSRPGGLARWVCRVLTSRTTAAKFDDVDKRITTCLVDLSAATGAAVESKINRLAARDHPRTNNKKPAKQGNAANAPQKYASNNNKNNNGSSKAGKQRGKGGKKSRAKKAAAPPPLAHAGVASYPNNGHGYVVHLHSMEEDPTSCSVM